MQEKKLEYLGNNVQMGEGGGAKGTHDKNSRR